MLDKSSKQQVFDSVEDMFLDMGIDIDELEAIDIDEIEAIEQARVDIANGDVVNLNSINW